MNSKQQPYILLACSMSPMEAYSESSNSSPTTPPTELTLFNDLLFQSESPNSAGTINHQEQYQQEDGCYYPFDFKSVLSGEKERPKPDNGLNMTRIHEGDKTIKMIKNKLVSSLSCHGFTAQVETIYRSEYSSCIMKQVRYRSFSLYSKGMEIKRNGNANVKYAWYGASKHHLDAILAHGFILPARPSGLSLSPVDQPLQSVQPAVPDENGVRPMLLCRVILGNTEAISPGSGQYKPSSEDFDSGVDNVMCPHMYIVWNGYMNTHILPEFVVRFRCSPCSSNCTEVIRKMVRQPPKVPSSDWLTFTSLIKDLSMFLPPDAIEFICKHHSEYKKQKITRGELIRQVRNIAGDKVLITIIKSCRNRSKHTGAGEYRSWLKLDHCIYHNTNT